MYAAIYTIIDTASHKAIHTMIHVAHHLVNGPSLSYISFNVLTHTG